MTEPIIVCPNCKTEIKLTESLAAPLIVATRQQYEKKIADKDKEMSAREEAVQRQKRDLEKEKSSIEEQFALRIQNERTKIFAEEVQRAKQLAAADIEAKANELAELKNVVEDRNKKLAEAQKAQAALIRKERELDDAKREMVLTIEKRVQESLSAVREKAKLEVEGSLKLKVTEREEQIASMQRQIEELRRKAEQGSQQLQGEAQEIELEALLHSRFPHDQIEPVPKGEFGGDVLQRVYGPQGQSCGAILWEIKRTKNWSDGWLTKLRHDQRVAKAEVALLVSHALPKDISSFDLREGVWVTEVRCAIPVAISLRQSLIELAAARQANEGQQGKVEIMYQYLVGPRFRHRVQAIVEKFADMQADLERERRAMTKSWAKREAQIRGVLESTAGMYGDLQGIAGKTLQEIDGLDFQLLEGPQAPIKQSES